MSEMKVMVKETGKIDTLELLGNNGINWVQDLIGNWGGLDQFEYNDEVDAHVCDQDTYDWWVALIEKQKGLDEMIAELNEKYGDDRVQEVLSTVDSNDLEDLVNSQIAALEEAFPETDEGN